MPYSAFDKLRRVGQPPLLRQALGRFGWIKEQQDRRPRLNTVREGLALGQASDSEEPCLANGRGRQIESQVARRAGAAPMVGLRGAGSRSSEAAE